MVAAVAKLHGARLALGDNATGLLVTLDFPHGIKVDIPEKPVEPAMVGAPSATTPAPDES